MEVPVALLSGKRAIVLAAADEDAASFKRRASEALDVGQARLCSEQAEVRDDCQVSNLTGELMLTWGWALVGRQQYGCTGSAP